MKTEKQKSKTQRLTDNLIEALKKEGIDLDVIQQNRIHNAILIAFMEGQDAFLNKKTKSLLQE